MRIDRRIAVVLAAVWVLGAGQLSAQTHPHGFVATAPADGPIARAAALQLAKLEHPGPEAEFNRDDRVTKGERFTLTHRRLPHVNPDAPSSAR